MHRRYFSSPAIALSLFASSAFTQTTWDFSAAYAATTRKTKMLSRDNIATLPLDRTTANHTPKNTRQTGYSSCPNADRQGTYHHTQQHGVCVAL